MNILADTGLWTNAWYYLSWVVPFLFVLGVVVFVHEMGHFLVARYFGVTVETFSVGFGKEIGGFYDRYGTRWRLAWVPLGGYVKFKGDENAASVPSKESLEGLSEAELQGNFHAKPVAQRAAVVVAGPLANFVLAIVILTAWFIFMGKPIIEPRVFAVEANSAAAEVGFKPGDLILAIDGTTILSFDDMNRIVTLNAETPLSIAIDRNGEQMTLVATPRLVNRRDPLGGGDVQVGHLGLGRPIIPPRIGTVRPDSAAAEAGIQPGDLIRTIDGEVIRSFEDVQRIVSQSPEKPLRIAIDRNGEQLTLAATPRPVARKDESGKDVQVGLLGVSPREDTVPIKYFGPVGAFQQSLRETYFWMKQPLIFIQKLTSGQASGDQVRGVVGIAQLSREVAAIGFVELFRWIAIISINIGLLNLFPIPMLDGGHLVFYGIEAIRGRPLSERTMEIGFRIGFALVIMLMLFATRNDVIHLIRQMG